MAATAGVMVGDLTYLVQSKFLQTQITKDFPEIYSLWGRSNYSCLSNSSRTCDECLATEENPCKRAGECPYKNAKRKALESSYRVTNFAYFLTEIAYVGRFSHNPFTVIDEADALENVLVGHIALSFTERSLYRLGLQDGPTRKTATAKDGVNSWRQFGQEALIRSTSIVSEVQREIKSIDDRDVDQKLRKMRELSYFVHLSERCQIFLNNVNSEWQMQEIPRRGSRQGQIIFQPTWISNDLAESFLWSHSENFMLISATFLPIKVECKRLGIDIDDVDFYEVPSTFDPDRSPVNLWPVANLVSKQMETETPKIIKAVKKILSWHPKSRGLIHTVSYQLCDNIMKGVNSSRLITHTSENRQDVINGYIDCFDEDIPDGMVLVSPSAERGLDLKYGLCKFIIICKMPFLSLGDKIVSSRLYGSGEIGKLWYLADAMSTIEQMAGRGNRADDDSVIVYILDGQVLRVYTQRPSLWSQSFRDSITWGDNELLEDPAEALEEVQSSAFCNHKFPFTQTSDMDEDVPF